MNLFLFTRIVVIILDYLADVCPRLLCRHGTQGINDLTYFELLNSC